MRGDRSRGRPIAGLIALVVGALTLAACQVPPHAMSSAVAQAPASASPETTAPAPKSILLAATPAVAHDLAPAARLTGDPKELVGLDHAVVRRALGDPVRIRTETPAQVWQYMTGDCVVDLYLYNQDGALTVAYVEARSHSAETAPTARCLKSLLERPTASAG